MGKTRNVGATAASWLVKLKADEDPEASLPGFRAWLESDPANSAAFRSVERAWKALQGLKELRPTRGPVDEDLLWKALQKGSRRGKARKTSTAKTRP